MYTVKCHLAPILVYRDKNIVLTFQYFFAYFKTLIEVGGGGILQQFLGAGGILHRIRFY